MMQRRALWSGDVDVWKLDPRETSVLERDSGRRRHRKRLYDMFRYPVSLAGYKRYSALGLNTWDDYCLHFNKKKIHIKENDNG